MMPYFLISKVDITILEIYRDYLNMQGFALNNIQNAYVGNTQVQSIYLGSTLIWPTTPPHDYSRDYLTFEALEPASFSFSTNNLQYSLDNGSTWITLLANTASPTVTTGNKILWKQTGLTPTSSSGIGTFSATGNFNVSGNIMSLLYGDNFIGQTDLTGKDYIFFGLFNSNTNLVSAENLILPATTLAEHCYVYMFNSCTSLTTSPELPATTLADSCYNSMFNACTSLTTAPELPATTLAEYCYENMFGGCTSLTTAPELPTTTLANYCYDHMFFGCSSLTTAPELPATTLAESCYRCMFYICTSLTTAPELPATTLALGCYDEMFRGCTSLITVPELPATTLSNYCYRNMFSGCTSLNYIKCLATNISASNCTYNWVNNVSSTGTFVKDVNTIWPTGASGIPSGWTTQNA